MWRNSRARHQRGFTLLEVLLAFAIVSVSLAILYQLWTSGLFRSDVTSKREIAVHLAETLLESTIADRRPIGTDQSGATPDGMNWQIKSATYPPAVLNSGFGWQPVVTEVSVTWQSALGGDSVSLKTILLSPSN